MNLNKGTLQTSRAEVDRLMAAAAAEKQKADAATLEATARAGQATAETKDVGARTQARTVFQNTAAVGGNLLGKLDRLATPRNAMIGAGVVGGGMLLWKLGKMIEQRHKLQTLQARKPAPGSLSPSALKAVAREAAAFELGQRTPWKEDELQRIAATSAKTASVSPYFQLGLYTGKG